MSRRNTTTLNLPEVENNFFPEANSKVIEVYERQGTDLAKIETAVTTHNAGTAARKEKHNYAQGKFVDMTICSSQSFQKTAEYLGEQSKKARGMYFEEETKTFNRHLLQLEASHNEGTLRISAKGIAEIVALPVLPAPEEPKKKKGFWERVFGD